MSRTLSVADVAKLRGVGRTAAYKWLRRNASKWLLRHGRFVAIDAERYGIISGMRPDPMSARVRALEERIHELESRFDAHVGIIRK